MIASPGTRLAHAPVLDAAGREGAGGALTAVTHTPSEEHFFSLTPVGEIATAVKSSGPILAQRDGNRVFLKKWPGLISAFDKLFSADTSDAVAARWQQFFRCVDPITRPTEDIATFAESIGAVSEDDRVRLDALLTMARDAGLRFDPTKIRRALSGSSPNEDRWYPSSALTTYVYYETALSVPRNENEGKAKGWGTMNQWGVPEAHLALPKLVYTTGSKPKYGLKAFVLVDQWHVKLHGGTSQQFSYTILENPLLPPRLGGMPNNITHEAEPIFSEFINNERNGEDFLLFIAGLYNSDISQLFLEDGGGNTLHVPLSIPSQQWQSQTSAGDCGTLLLFNKYIQRI